MRVDEAYEIPPQLIGPLTMVYQYEADQVNQKNNVGSQFDIEWTLEDLKAIIDDCEIEPSELLDFLREHRRMVIFYDSSGDERAYRTDTAELVRLSSFNYNRYPNKKSSELVTTQSGVTWAIENKMTPKWSVGIEEVRGRLLEEVVHGWMDEASNHQVYNHKSLEKAIEIVCNAYEAGQRKKGREAFLSEFQVRSIQQTLRGIYSTGAKGLAILAGTGSGKSYGFQIGGLIAVVEQRLSKQLNTVHSLFLYPRVALMDDQREAMEELIEVCNFFLAKDEQVRYATDGGSALKMKDYKRLIEPGISDEDLEKKRIGDVIKAIYGDELQCPHIVFANPDSLTYRLANPTAAKALVSNLKNLVFDEVHLLESITGANTAGVIRRLCAQSSSEIMLTGSSATIADANSHLSKVFAIPEGEVIKISPEEEEMEHTGIIHHVFHRGMEGSSFKTNLTNLTSLITHGRRRRTTEPPRSSNEAHKTLGFADSLNLLGSWEYLLRDNEGLEFSKTVQRNLRNGKPVSNLMPEKIPLPYRFSTPLCHIDPEEVGYSEKEIKSHCESCINGTSSVLKNVDSDLFRTIHLDGYRNDQLAIMSLNEMPEKIEVGVTDQCPYFQLGACWREEKSFSPSHLYNNGPAMYSNSVFPIKLTSQSIAEKKNKNKSEVNHFEISKKEYLELPSSAELENDRHFAEIALSSPAIEVGMDFDNALDAVLFKAIRNISAYRQKVGRLGRERYRDVYAAMMTSFRAIDYHYYRNPTALLDNNRLEPIPLTLENDNVKKQMVYMALFDHLAMHGPGNSIYIADLRSSDSYSDTIDLALTYLQTEKNPICNHLSSKLKVDDQQLCKEVLEEVCSQLQFLTLDINEFLRGDARCMADRIGSQIGIKGSSARRRNGMHDLELTPQGTQFVSICNKVMKCLREIAIYGDQLKVDDADLLRQLADECKSLWADYNLGESRSLDRFLTLGSPERMSQLMAELSSSNLISSNIGVAIMNYIPLCHEISNTPVHIQNMLIAGQIPLGKSMEDWNIARRNTLNFNVYYLRNLFSTLHSTKHRLPFVFQTSLFKPPNEKSVAIFVPRRSASGGSGSHIDVPIAETLFSHVPGMWTYRRSATPMKAKCYQQLQPITDNPHAMHLPLNNSGEDADGAIKHQFIEKKSINFDKLPWDFILDSAHQDIVILEPLQINLMFSGSRKRGNSLLPTKHVDGGYVLIRDGDDAPDESLEKMDEESNDEQAEDDETIMPINVPESYPISWRNLQPTFPVDIKPFKGPFDKEFKPSAMSEILFSNVAFDSTAKVSEFVLGVTRKYQGGSELEIKYTLNNHNEQPVAIGHDYTSNAICFEVNSRQITESIQWAEMQASSKDGHATRYQILQHLFKKKYGWDRFRTDIFLRLLLHSREFKIPTSMGDWLDTIACLSEEEVERFSEAWFNSSLKHIDIRYLKEAVKRVWENSPTREDLSRYQKDWAVRTYTNSLGIHMLQSGREYSGSRDEDIGYHVECDAESDADEESVVNIWLYDRSPDGNGTTKTIADWFEIPRIVSETMVEEDLASLPTRDFITCLGEYLEPCKAHQSGVIAWTSNHKNIDLSSLKGLKSLYPDIEFERNSYDDDWQLLHTKFGFVRAEYPFVELILPLIPGYGDEEVRIENLRKAVTGCHASCVECLQEFGVSMLGSLSGPTYANKRMLDHVLSTLMLEQTKEFRRNKMSFDGYASGIAGTGTEVADEEFTYTVNGQKKSKNPMIHPRNLWEEINSDEPFTQNGTVQFFTWKRLDVPRCSE